MALMIRCPLTGLACGKPIVVQEKTFFLAEPAKPEKERDRRWKAIEQALGQDYEIRSALSERQQIAFSCKLCEIMQCCAYGMADITGYNPNVLLELGMMLALGKPAIILCKKGEEEQLKLPSDLNAIEVLLFEDHIDIIDQLKAIAASLPQSVAPPSPAEATEEAVRLTNPRLADELKITLDSHREQLLTEFQAVIKEAKLETISPPEERTPIPARLEESLGKLEETLQQFEKLGFATDAKTAFYRGNFHYKRRQYEAALDQYDWSLTLHPDHPDALAARATTYAELGRWDEALADFNRALELRPDFPAALSNRAVAYKELGRHDEALADLNQSLELRPDFPGTLNNRAIVYKELGRFAEALADLNRALEVQPERPGTFYNLACIFALTLKADDALAYLEKAIASDPNCRKEGLTDSDFDSIRDDPRFRRLVEGA